MAGIHEKVRLTNALDEHLCQIGMLWADQVRSVEVRAVVDTDAVFSVVPAHVMERLGIEVSHRRSWKDHAEISEELIFSCQERDTIDEAIIGGTEILIGRTVVAKWDMVEDGAKGRLMPHPERPNQPVSMPGAHRKAVGFRSGEDYGD